MHDLDIVTIDFESYYASDYTLAGKDMNMSEYVRDNRFKAHLVGIKINDQPTQIYLHEDIPDALSAIDWEHAALLCHNTAFDGFILSEIYDIRPAFYLDTLSISRAVHPPNVKHNLDFIAKMHGLGGKVKGDNLVNTKGKRDLTEDELIALGEYCADDVEDTYKLYKIMEPFIPEDELKLIDLTIRMFCDPVLIIDEELLQEFHDQQIADKMKALLKIGVTADVLRSNQKFADALIRLGVKVPIKPSPTTGKATFAFAKTDRGFIYLRTEHPDQRVRDLCEARLLLKSSIKETRAKRMLNTRDGGSRTLPVHLNYSGAHTHRWSGGNKMNMQNLTRKSALRESVLAPEGHVLVVVDLAQIEARMLAWLAGHDKLVKQFANDDPIYELMAAEIYNKPVETISKDSIERFVGKVCILGLGYGMGAPKLAHTLATGGMGRVVIMSEAQCYEIVTQYRLKNRPIPALWKLMERIITDMTVGKAGELKCLEYGKGFIRLPNGLFLQYPNLQGIVHDTGFFEVVHDVTYEGGLKADGPIRKKLYGGLLTENVVQALSRVLIGEQMLAVAEHGYRIVTMTHDEIVTCVPEAQAQQCFDDMVRIMTTPPKWAPDLPLGAEGGWARNYSK